MKGVIIDNVNYGELVKVVDAYLQRFYAEKLGLTYTEATDTHQIITDMNLDCDLGRFQVSVFLLKKEDFMDTAKAFSKLYAVERVALQSHARNLVVFQDGVQVGDVRTLDYYYNNIPTEMLELTNFK